MAVICDSPRAPRGWIDRPDVRNPQSQVIIKTLLQRRESIGRRKHLNTNIRRAGENLFVRFRELDYTDVWNAIAAWTNLHALFGKCSDAERTAAFAKPGVNLALKFAVVLLPWVAIDEPAFNVVAVRTVGCAEILVSASSDAVLMRRV